MSVVKKPVEIEKIARAGEILHDVKVELRKAIKPGITALSLDALARTLIEKAGAIPAFLNYQPHGAKHPYPATICASINNVIVHGVPTSVVLKNGDLISVDLGARVEGYCADTAFTVGVGAVPVASQKLLAVTREALARGIKAAKPGNTLGDIGHAIQSYIEGQGFSVVEGLTGHGIGKNLHEDPSVYNYGNPGKGMKLKAGMALALEPMVSVGTSRIIQLADESYATADGSLSAHFEDTIVITEKGAKILTS